MNSELITSIDNYTSFVYAKTKDNCTMIVNPNDQYISRNMLYAGEWEPHIREMMKKIIKDGMVTMDIGANIGTHTLLMSRLAGDTGKVYAFEPCKLNHDVLVYNCILNRCSNVMIYKYGCGDKSKTMYIDKQWSQSKKEDNYGCIFLQSDQKSNNDESIKVIKIDDMKLEKLDFVKIDAENMEDKVLEGMRETVKRCKPLIIVEIHEGDIKHVVPIIHSLNYDVKFIGGIDYLATPKEN
jgi:FkbM family methyltransferase